MSAQPSSLKLHARIKSIAWEREKRGGRTGCFKGSVETPRALRSQLYEAFASEKPSFFCEAETGSVDNASVSAETRRCSCLAFAPRAHDFLRRQLGRFNLILSIHKEHHTFWIGWFSWGLGAHRCKMPNDGVVQLVRD